MAAAFLFRVKEMCSDLCGLNSIFLRLVPTTVVSRDHLGNWKGSWLDPDLSKMVSSTNRRTEDDTMTGCQAHRLCSEERMLDRQMNSGGLQRRRVLGWNSLYLPLLLGCDLLENLIPMNIPGSRYLF